MRRVSRRIALAGAACMLVLAMVFIGASGRGQVSERVQNSLDIDTGLPNRMNAWTNGLKIAEDFPALGTRTSDLAGAVHAIPLAALVGAVFFGGAQRLPANDCGDRDYRAGAGGVVSPRAAIFIYRRFALLPGKIVPIQAALVTGLAVMCVVEFSILICRFRRSLFSSQ